MTNKETIKNNLLNCNTVALVALHNDAVSYYGMVDDYIYNMEEFDNMNNVFTPWEIARMAFFGNFRPCDDYFYYNGYGNLESFEYWKEKENFIDLDMIADYLMEEDTSNMALIGID